MQKKYIAVAALFALVVSLLSLLLAPRDAFAHSPTLSVYSKYEASTYERSVAVVFALDKASLLQLLDERAPHPAGVKVEPQDIPAQLPFFSDYVFARFTVSNDGAACAHPDRLGRFFWDEATGRVLAVTKFTCATDLHELAIHAAVTHDMPTSHELVGDFTYNGANVRDYFANDDLDTTIDLSTLKPGMESGARKRRGKFSYVPVPDRVRRYDALARAELGIDASQTTPSEAGPEVPWTTTLAHFIGEGIKHIFTGYDHVLFIVTLIFAVGTWRKLAVIVTSFTAAHSITLVLATLGVVTLPSKLVEPLIAASVLFVAVDAVLRPQASARAAVTFGFGLLHGFGLSSVLRDLGLAGRELVPALLGFNVGVEIGQIAIVAPLFPLVLLLRRKETTYARARSILCASVAVIATFWIVLRVWEAFRA